MNGDIYPDIDTLNYIKNYPENNPDFILDEDIRFTSIIILTFNQLEYTKLCIESIRAFTAKACYEIIVVDNNSSDGTVDWLKEQDDLVVIYNSKNEGFPVGCNIGMEVAKGESILLLNNDTIVTPNWLSKLNKNLYSDEKIGAVGAVTNSCSNGQQIYAMYVNVWQMINLSKEFYMLHKGEIEFKPKLVGFCYLIKKEVLDKTGLLDPIFTPGNYEDDDISLRIMKAGYLLGLCRDTMIHHFGSVSFKKDATAYSAYLAINNYKLNSKWKFDINSKNFARHELLEIMKGDTNKKINVLDINCGIGATLIQVKNIFKNASIYGIESDENVSVISKGLCDGFAKSVDEMKDNFKENMFHYIILTDVLSRVQNPLEVLKKVIKYLKPNGSIITSVPNINYIGVINGLANGDFTYLNHGILNEKNIKFFTLNEINKLFENAGVLIKDLKKDEGIVTNKDNVIIEKLCEIYGYSKKDEYRFDQYRICGKKVMDINRYKKEEMQKFRYLIMRVDNGFDSDDTFDEIFDLADENFFAIDINFLIKNNVINKGIVLSKILNEAIKRGLNYLLEDFGGLYYE